MKKCTKCKETKNLSEFGKLATNKDSLHTQCKSCKRAYYSKYRSNNSDTINNTNKKWAKDNPNKVKKSHEKYRKDNQAKVKESGKKWIEANKGYVNANAAKYRASKIKATPSWSETEKIKEVYAGAKRLENITGLNYHVDHILPLNGKNVCGLHCWQNLQVLEANINIIKSNKL